jgi:hypothetical protein
MWALLEDEQKIKYALDEMEEATDRERVNYLVGEIDKIWAAAPDHAVRAMPTGGNPYSKALEFLQEHEQERAKVQDEVLAKHAAADEAVLAFRGRFLDGEPLTPEQAQAFVTSLANQHLPVQWFEDHGVSFLDHIVHTRQHDVDYRGELIEFTVQPSGITCRVEKHALSEEYGGGEMLSVAGDPPDVIGRRRNDVWLPSPGEVNIAQHGDRDLGYWRGFSSYVRTDSPLGELRDLGNDLTKRYPGWETHLRNAVRAHRRSTRKNPLWTEKGSSDEIVIRVAHWAAPWISPESVKNAYTREVWFQSWLNEHYGGEKAKRRRRLSDKNLKLLRFVTERLDHRGQRPRGKDVAAAWDAEHFERPKWLYHGDTRSMWRDYNRALQEVAPSVAGKKSEI